MTFVGELIAIVILCGVANSLLGMFLVLRGTSLISFGLAHSILFGIVLAFLITSSLTSPLLLVGAALTGVLIVSLIELLSSSEFIRYDAALGLIYLTVFALGIILLSRYAQNTTLSLNSVVAGQIVFAPFVRTTILGIDLPSIIWIMSVFLVLNIIFLLLFYKELVLTSFDPLFAELIGTSPQLMSYLLMILTSLTIVGSYTAVGAVLVVAFMITPPATALLYSKTMRGILITTSSISVLGGLTGLFLALELDVSIAGSIAVVYGMVFLISLLTGPQSHLRDKIMGTKRAIEPPPNYLVEHGGQ